MTDPDEKDLESKGSRISKTRSNEETEFFANIFLNSPIGIYILQEGKFVFVNPEFQRISGYKQEELLHKHSSMILLPEDWVVEEITTSDPLMNGHALSLYPRLQGQGVVGWVVRMTFRRVGEEVLLWPTGVGEGEFVSQGTLDVAGQHAKRVYFVCPTGQVQSIWYQGAENQPNIRRGDLEFGFIFSLTGVYCDGDHSLGGKVQRVGEMIIASLKVP